MTDGRHLNRWTLRLLLAMVQPTSTILSRLRRRWLAEGLQICLPASEEAIREFETREGIRFSKGLRSYFRLVNGLAENELSGLARLWPLAEVRRLPAVYPSELPEAGRLLAFGDYNIEAIYWALRLSRGEPATDGAVVAVCNIAPEDIREVAPNIGAFFRRHVQQSPESVM